jgi:hypothetical protein
MKRIILLFAIIISTVCVNSQNPFAEYGYTPKIATLSQGQYNEFFDNDTLVQIGSVLFNTKSKQIVAFVETDTLYSEATLEPDIVSRWISPDPLAVKYPQISPYVYVKDNPIIHIDPDGRDAVVVVFPDYKISTPVGKIGGIGHAGVLLIDNKTGLTKYYEYGRYDKEGKGLVRSFAVSNVKIGIDGKPTVESLNKVMGQISDKAGHDGKIEGAYIKSDKFKEMNNYAQDKMKDNNNPNREKYNLTDNNCGTFATDVANQDKKVEKEAPTIIDPRPNSMISEYQQVFPAVNYDPEQNKTPVKQEKK